MQDNSNSKIKLIVKIFVITILIFLVIMFLLFLKHRNYDEIELKEEVVIVKVGEYKLLPFVVSDNNEKGLIFNSLNPEIAKIDNQGYIFGVKVGETNITVKFDKTSNEKTCKVKVIEEKKEDNQNNKKDDDDPQKPSNPQDEDPNIINPICKLKVSKEGMITAEVSNAIKYSFDKKLSKNEIKKKIQDISDKEIKDYEGWKYYRINYYVESESNTKKTCSIIVIEKCNNSGCTYEAY